MSLGSETNKKREPHRIVHQIGRHNNTNHIPIKATVKLDSIPLDAKPKLSRREVRTIAAQQHYAKLHAKGKTEQQQQDLARLEIIRKERLEAAAKREAERKSKNEEIQKKK